MNSQTNDTEDESSRPEGDMTVGSTSIALGGRKSSDATPAPESSDAQPDGSGSVGDGKQPAAENDTNSGTSSTSVGSGSGGSNEP